MNATIKRYSLTLLAVGLSTVHFFSFDLFSQPIQTDIRFYLYFAWQVTEGAIPHRDFFDIKTQLSTFLGALFYVVGKWLSIDPLYAIRIGYLALSTTGGLLVFLIHRRLGRGSYMTGFIGLLAYCSFGLMGFLPAIGNIPKLLVTLCASAMALLVYERKYWLAGLVGALAFMDWQIGILVWIAAFASAIICEGFHHRASIKVVTGGVIGLSPFIIYYGLNGGLLFAFNQTIVASFFRGSMSLEKQSLFHRLGLIKSAITSACPGQEWLFVMSLCAIPIMLLWLWREYGTDKHRLLVPLSIYHFGIFGFSLIDFQWYGDLFVLLHSAVFFLAVAWNTIYRVCVTRLLRKTGVQVQHLFGLSCLTAALLISRPSILRPDVSITSGMTLADQQEVAATVERYITGKTFVLLQSSELLFLMKYRNPLPTIFWDNVPWSYYRSSTTESIEDTAVRMIESVAPDVFIYKTLLQPESNLAKNYTPMRITSTNGKYSVVLQVRKTD